MLRLLLLAALVSIVVPASALAAGADAQVSAAQAIAALNTERAENGIPAGITENPQWSADCALHDHWMAVNNLYQHDEVAGTPAYTDAGNWAGTHADIAASYGADWSPDTTIWETAPLHLMQLLDPALVETGFADSEGYQCMTTFPGWEDIGPSDTIYTYPGDGRVNVPGSEIADEWPFVPGDYAGVPAGSESGPYLYVLPDGPWTNDYTTPPAVTSASLNGPSGPVELKVIDSTHKTVGPYMPNGSAFLIPPSPLADGVYTASVTLSGGGDTITKQWQFTVGPGNTGSDGTGQNGNGGGNSGTTAPDSNLISISTSLCCRARVHGKQTATLRVRVHSNAPNVTVTVFTVTDRSRIYTTHTASFSLRAASRYTRVRICAASGGGQSGYLLAHTCVVSRVR